MENFPGGECPLIICEREAAGREGISTQRDAPASVPARSAVFNNSHNLRILVNWRRRLEMH